MKLVIIAGGKGERLGFSDIPKPMVLVDEKPILEYQIDLARRYGITEIYILLGYLSELVIEYFGDGGKFGVKINYIVEKEPLGTAGAVKQLEGLISDRFMVFYADTIMDINLDEMIKFDARYCDSVGTLLVHPNDHPYDSDLFEIDDARRIIAVYPKPHPEDGYFNNLVNACLYIFSPAIFAHIKAGEKSDFGKNIFPSLVGNGADLRGYPTPEYIKDMGTPDRLERVTQDVQSGKVARLNKIFKRKAIFLDRDGIINEEVDIVRAPEQFKLIDGVAEAISKINKSEYLTVVITNQPGLAKGFNSVDSLKEIHRKMEYLLGRQRAYLDGLYYCPHHPDKGFEGEIIGLKIDCECRKPKIGMLRRAVEDFNIDLDGSYFIGDTLRDMKTAENAGIKGILVKTGYGGSDNQFDAKPDHEFESLSEAVDHILNNNKQL